MPNNANPTHAMNHTQNRTTQTAKDQAKPSGVPLDDGLDKGNDRHLTPQVEVDDKNTIDKGDHERHIRDTARKDAERDAATGRPHRP